MSAATWKLSSNFPFPPRKQWRALAHGPYTTHLDYSEQDYTSILPVLYSAGASELSPFRLLCNKRISKLACGRKVIYLNWTAMSVWGFFINLFSNLQWRQIPHGFQTEIHSPLRKWTAHLFQMIPPFPYTTEHSQPCQHAPLSQDAGWEQTLFSSLAGLTLFSFLHYGTYLCSMQQPNENIFSKWYFLTAFEKDL